MYVTLRKLLNAYFKYIWKLEFYFLGLCTYNNIFRTRKNEKMFLWSYKFEIIVWNFKTINIRHYGNKPSTNKWQLLIVNLKPERRRFVILVVVVVVAIDVVVVVIFVAARLFVTLSFLSFNLSAGQMCRRFFDQFWTSLFDAVRRRHWRRLHRFRCKDGSASGGNNSISGGGNRANFVVAVPIFVLTKSRTIFGQIAAAASLQSLTSAVPTNRRGLKVKQGC